LGQCGAGLPRAEAAPARPSRADAPDPLVRRETRPREGEEFPGELAAGHMTGGKPDKGFRPDDIRTRHDRSLGDRRMLDEHALEFERTDPVVGTARPRGRSFFVKFRRKRSLDARNVAEYREMRTA
jgi:hypothetical protein